MVTDHFYPRTESSISLWGESSVWNHTLQARQKNFPSEVMQKYKCI